MKIVSKAREVRLNLRLDAAEMRAIRAAATEEGEAAGTYARRVLLHDVHQRAGTEPGQ
jgi:predicted DNA binding CopG/RHH family protein